jgi:hypothetical protein
MTKLRLAKLRTKILICFVVWFVFACLGLAIGLTRITLPWMWSKGRVPFVPASFYDFATYQEAHSQEIFRLDLDACHYRNLTVADRLAEAHTLIEGVGSPDWLELPKRIKCHRCSEIFSNEEAQQIRPSREDYVDAYTIPAA